MLSRIIVGAFLLGVIWFAWSWMSTPSPLDSPNDGITEWQAASTRQKNVTVNHYLRFWELSVPASDLQACIDERIKPDCGIGCTASMCALIYLVDD